MTDTRTPLDVHADAEASENDVTLFPYRQENGEAWPAEDVTLEEAWEQGRAAAQKLWVTVTQWGGSVPDGVVEHLNPYSARTPEVLS